MADAQELPDAADHPAPGWLVDGEVALDGLLERCVDSDVEILGLTAGAHEPVGIHLGALVRDDFRHRLHKSDLRLITVYAPLVVLDGRPDEGVSADLIAHIELAADLGAESLTVKLTSTEFRDAATRGSLDDVVARVQPALARAAELDVVLSLRNSLATPKIADVRAVADALQESRVHTDPQNDDDVAPAVGIAWNVVISEGAGESLMQSWQQAQELLLASEGYVLCRDVASAQALHEAVPESAPVPVLVESPPAS